MQSSLAKAFYMCFNKKQDPKELESYESVIKRAFCEFPDEEKLIDVTWIKTSVTTLIITCYRECSKLNLISMSC